MVVNSYFLMGQLKKSGEGDKLLAKIILLCSLWSKLRIRQSLVSHAATLFEAA